MAEDGPTSAATNLTVPGYHGSEMGKEAKRFWVAFYEEFKSQKNYLTPNQVAEAATAMVGPAWSEYLASQRKK